MKPQPRLVGDPRSVPSSDQYHQPSPSTGQQYWIDRMGELTRSADLAYELDLVYATLREGDEEHRKDHRAGEYRVVECEGIERA